MGNMLLMLVFGMILAYSNFAGNMNVRMLAITDNSVGYYESVQSRNIAASMMAIAQDTLSRNSKWRAGYYNFPIDGGVAALTVKDSLSYVVLEAYVVYGSESMRVKAVYQQNLPEFEFVADGDKWGHNHKHPWGHNTADEHANENAYDHGHDDGADHSHTHEAVEGELGDFILISWRE